MRILLTNDDGLRAPGIQALYEALVDAHGEFGDSGGPLGEVTCIAPLTVQSATSHGVTFHEPLMIREERLGWAGRETMSGVAVDGRPADCVKLAIAAIWPEKFGAGSRPDLLISGMNAGANVGINVIYSGTVAAALEGAFLGIPSIAVSLHIGAGGMSRTDFRAGARHARRAIEQVLRNCPKAGPDAKWGLPEQHACVSINVPVTALDSPEAEAGHRYPVRICPMNTHGLNDKYERRTSPGGDVYYWASGHGLDFRTTNEGSDVEQIFRKVTTVTPLRYDLTKKSTLATWRARVEQGGAGV
ncbi:MAG: 5'/3'-nucleotidase SurE [Phycisphaeraceae bacterium]|nr:5'/3'-nucleotidase SurE [Phycisphaeraceae bacterium]